MLIARRTDSTFQGRACPYVDGFLLLLMLAYSIWLLPLELLWQGPASGGDMGSHFWPLKALVDYGIPQGRLRMWNPGNLAGEPYFLQYFPLPYFVMAALNIFFALGNAFNIGTVLPLLLFPCSVYTAFRIVRLPFPAPIFGAAFAQVFLFNESYSMWGGNALSTLSGQFAHGYALNFYVLALAYFAREFAARRLPLRGIVVSTAVGLSHAYVFLGIPFLLATPLLSSLKFWKQRALHAVVAGTFIMLFLLWFIVPMLGNGAWTTDFSYRWSSGTVFSEALPLHFVPFMLAGVCCGAALITRRGQVRRLVRALLVIFLCPLAGFAALYFLFPYVGLIDIRALPQVTLLGLMLSGALCGLALRYFLPRFTAEISVVIVLLTLATVDRHIQQFPGWARWNYSGWTTKPLYEPLQNLSGDMRGTLSDPRVAYEHSTINQAAGTERVFEMLPYFADRATLESVYHYASLISPAAFHLQAEISSTPSCPFPQYECPRRDFSRAALRAALLGVNDIILVNNDTKKMAKDSGFWTEKKTYGPWTVFSLHETPELVEIPAATLYPASAEYWNGRFKVRERASKEQAQQGLEVPPHAWKERFYQWLLAYDGKEPYMYFSPEGGGVQPLSGTNRNCSARVHAKFNRITLKTSCPGYPHVLKFSYHGDWMTDTGDSLFAVSPGFIGLIPSSTEVKLTFGGTPAWQISSFITLAAAAVFFFVARRVTSF